MNETDIWRTAHAMIQQYGAQAQAHARQRADTLREHGMVEEAAEWTRVAQAIAELDRKSPDDDEPVN